MLAGCAGAPRWGTWAQRPTEAELVAAVRGLDQYAYFPGHEIYYNRTQGYFVYLDENGWVERFELPEHIDKQQLLSSPFVEMAFHDDPQGHHAEVSRAYPREWGQADSNLALNR